MNLHLQYRLWIAEMNADINVLRIFEDYLMEIESKSNNAETINQVSDYRKEFLDLRQELDALRHEMHLVKMKLAATARTQDASINNIEKEINHQELKDRYTMFRNIFGKTENEFKALEIN